MTNPEALPQPADIRFGGPKPEITAARRHRTWRSRHEHIQRYVLAHNHIACHSRFRITPAVTVLSADGVRDSGSDVADAFGPVQGEALDSWLEALAHRNDVRWRDILAAVGLPPARFGCLRSDHRYDKKRAAAVSTAAGDYCWDRARDDSYPLSASLASDKLSYAGTVSRAVSLEQACVAPAIARSV